MKVIMTGSATGGHIYPAIAIAEKIKRKDEDAEILFISAKKELGSTIVKDYGYDCEYIDVSGFNRRNLLKNFKVVKDLMASSRQIRKILDDFKPDMVIGTGGYVSGPVIREAKKKNIRTYLHEQNAFPGMSNKMAEKYTDKVFVAYKESEKYFKGISQIVETGNPVRKEFITLGLKDYRKEFGIDPKDMAILIFGGSRGADRINEVTVEFLEKIKDDKNIRVFFITGSRQYEEIMEVLQSKGLTDLPQFDIINYADNIHEYYGAADLIISRSGALTVSEITVCGKPSILIPSPNVTNNHQYFNAKPLADKGAAIILEEANLNSSRLYDEVLELKNNKPRLNSMAKASESIGHANAVDIIYDEIMKDG